MSKIAGEINAEMMKGYAATTPQELERQIMSSLVPKNEREHWAAREITHLRNGLENERATTEAFQKVIQQADEDIKNLRQQLADRGEQISDLTISSDTYFAERNSARDVWRRASKDRDELRQQLAHREAQIALLREALESVKSQRIDGHVFPAVVDMNAWHSKVINALAATPDDALAAVVERVKEQCAVAAWSHYMDTCQKRKMAAGDCGHWLACDAIRNLKVTL